MGKDYEIVENQEELIFIYNEDMLLLNDDDEYEEAQPGNTKRNDGYYTLKYDCFTYCICLNLEDLENDVAQDDIRGYYTKVFKTFYGETNEGEHQVIDKLKREFYVYAGLTCPKYSHPGYECRVMEGDKMLLCRTRFTRDEYMWECDGTCEYLVDSGWEVYDLEDVVVNAVSEQDAKKVAKDFLFPEICEKKGKDYLNKMDTKITVRGCAVPEKNIKEGMGDDMKMPMPMPMPMPGM